MAKYSIVIPTYNHLEDCLKPCIESIIKYTDLDNTEIGVVANGCKDGTREYLEKLHNDGIINFFLWFDDPIGFPKAVNEGIMASQGEYVVILNNDTVLIQQEKNKWLHDLERPFFDYKDIVATGPHFLRSYIVDHDFIVFFCAMIKRKIFEEFDLLDESFSPGGCEDIDFCYLVQKAGFKIARVPDNNFENRNFPIYHKPESTVRDLSDWNEIFRSNTEKLLKKHSKVAVIMPAYNEERFIEKTAAAILNQDVENVILFIINDCSIDGTKNAIERIKDEYYPRVKSINLPLNVDASAGRNLILSGLKKDNSFTHVAFCDADDLWTNKSHLRESILLMDEKRVDVVYSDVFPRFDNGKEATPYGISEPPQIFNKEKLVDSNFIYVSSAVMTRSAAISGYFDSRLDGIEDWDFWCQLAHKGFDFYHKRSIDIEYTVKITGGGASRSNPEKVRLLKSKYKTIKLNLGCGEDLKEGYINCDLYPKNNKVRNVDCQFLPFADDSIDEILASHLIEHFPFPKIGPMLNEWFRALKHGGKLVLETPDAYHTYKTFVEKPDLRLMLYGHLHAFPMEPGNAHYFLFTEDQLFWMLQQAGFRKCRRIQPFSNYVQDHPKEWYLAVEAYKI